MKIVPKSARKQILITLLATILASAVAALITYQVYTSLGGGLGAGIISYYLLIVVYPLAELLALWRFKIVNWVGIGLVFSAFVLGGYSASQGGIDSLHPRLDAALEIATAIAVLAALWLIFNRLSAHIIARWFIALAAAGLAFAGVYYYAHAQEQTYQRTTEQTAENSVNFQAYVPTSLPLGTKMEDIELPSASGKQILDATSSTPFIELHFSGTLYEGYESKVDSSFNPPASCGPTIPGFQYGTIAAPCDKVSSVGKADVYLYHMTATQPPEQEYYIKMGDTRIELTSPGRELTGTEISDFVNGLQPQTPAQIKKLNDSLTPPAR